MSVLLWLCVPLVLTAVTAGSRHRASSRRPRPATRELVRRALVVLPTDDDRRALLRAIARVLDTDPRVDVLLVERTPDAAGTEQLAPRVTVLRAPDVTSDTEALQAGAARALTHGYDAVVELSVRHPRLSRRVTALLEALDDGAHVAVGSRYVPGGRVVGCPCVRRLASRSANAALRWVTRASVSDVTAPMRGYRREAVERALLPASGAHRARGVEVMLRSRDAGLRITEVPVTVGGPLCAAVTPAESWDVLTRAIRLRRRFAAASAPAVIDLSEPVAAAAGH